MIFISDESDRPATRSISDLRAATTGGGLASLVWQRLHAGAEAALGTPPLVPGSAFPGRDTEQVKHANRDFVICQATGRRLLRDALVFRLTGDDRFRTDALEQLTALFDPDQWPLWRDLSHPANDADLRTGMLAAATAITLDWLRPHLSASEVDGIVAGIDRCAIQPFRSSVDQGAFWLNSMHNWQTVVVGGLGIAGMALDGLHRDAAWLVELSLESMQGYLEILGPEGEFNESVGYATALHYPVRYFAAYRSYASDEQDPLLDPRFAESCRWLMYATLPAGHLVPFGDAHSRAPMRIDYVAAIAAATRDSTLQWFFERNQRLDDDPYLLDPLLFLWHDPSLEARAPDDRTPLARSYRAWGAITSSRSSWTDPSAVVVVGKAGRERNHEHHDDGQLVIEAAGVPLIVDLGSPSSYPADFFGPDRNRYYNADVSGHNVLQLGSRPMVSAKPRSGVYLHRWVGASGAAWSMDLTSAYQEAELVRRSVVHLLPGLVVVLDEARVRRSESLVLRWHTASPAEIDARGVFTVAVSAGEQGGARLVGRLASLSGDGRVDGEVRFDRHEHRYVPPFHTSRLGEPLEQRRESYVSATVEHDRCRYLTVFHVGPMSQPSVSPDWSWPPTVTADGWHAAAANAELAITVSDTRLRVGQGTTEISVPVAV